MSEMLEWRERLESAYKLLQDAMTELITNKNYPEADADCTLSTSSSWI